MPEAESSRLDRPRIAVVSGYGNDRFTPRGQRTKWLVEALEDKGWQVDLITMREKPSSARAGGTHPRVAELRRRLGGLVYRLLLDRWEPWALRRFRRWRPEADAAVLVAAPWSPVVYASRRLVAANVPYVADVGDPWVLTTDEELAQAPRWRARRDETFLWEHAAGSVVTTTAQADSLKALFPQLSMLVRPNGYAVVDTEPSGRGDHDPSVLRLAHFGILSAGRIDPVPFLEALARSGRWRSIVFDQFGDDFGAGMERRVPASVEIRRHETRPWDEIVARADDFDAALVIAYPLPSLLPSKAIEYASLPLPRIALTNPDPDDALRQHAADHRGWLAVSNGEAGIADRVAAHVERDWSPAELSPPESDSWPAVGAHLASYITERLTGAAGNVAVSA